MGGRYACQVQLVGTANELRHVKAVKAAAHDLGGQLKRLVRKEEEVAVPVVEPEAEEA